jgi:hypothetical protein
MVQRYDYDTKIVDGWEERRGVFENDNGGYVKYEDYLVMTAQVEVLKKVYRNLCGAINDMDDCEEGSEEAAFAIVNVFAVMKRGYQAVNEPPAACLAEVRAEAGRAGYLQGIEDWRMAEHNYKDFDISFSASEYAESIRQEVNNEIFR